MPTPLLFELRDVAIWKQDSNPSTHLRVDPRQRLASTARASLFSWSRSSCFKRKLPSVTQIRRSSRDSSLHSLGLFRLDLLLHSLDLGFGRRHGRWRGRSRRKRCHSRSLYRALVYLLCTIVRNRETAKSSPKPDEARHGEQYTCLHAVPLVIHLHLEAEGVTFGANATPNFAQHSSGTLERIALTCVTIFQQP